MFAVHDDGEINFYEALGVAPDASAQEIREAFHLHVRLLHPDQHADPQLRNLAEKQMRKLNRIYAVLSDPHSRNAYDLAVHGIAAVPPAVDPAPLSEFRRLAAKTPWAAAILVSAGALIWLAYDATPPSQNRSFDPDTVRASSSSVTTQPAQPARGGMPESASAQIARLKAALRAAETQRDEALHQLAKLRGTTETGTAETPLAQTPRPAEVTPATPPPIVAESAAAPKLPAPSPVIANASPPRVVNPANRRLAGFWFYAVPPEGQQNKNRALYLPEFIEATIAEDNGTIHGRYRSRFMIEDRAIPPDVNFTFTGNLSGTQCTCQWTGGGGARGQVTLRLTGENSMKVDWAATELGSLGLASGTAILTRRIESTN